MCNYKVAYTMNTTPELTVIKRKILIGAPRSRVWRALTSAQDFSKWFSARFEGSFEQGKRLEMVSTHPCGNNARFYIIIERMEPEHRFSWRWHPGSANPAEDASTLVEFHLEEVEGGTLVTVTESGFDQISLARRAKAFEENSNGWEIQLESLRRYASQAS